jgi:hypothetical protein
MKRPEKQQKVLRSLNTEELRQASGGGPDQIYSLKVALRAFILLEQRRLNKHAPI